MKKIIATALQVAALLQAFAASDAAASPSRATVMVRVTMLAKPACTIRGVSSTDIVVDFRSMDISKIPNHRAPWGQYTIPVDYRLTCTDPRRNELRMKIEGGIASFDNRMLRTSQDELAVLFRQGEQLLPIGEWINFSYTNQPKITATPVKQFPSSALVAGNFSASATLMVAYP